jgi:hypothetical protein
MRNPQLTSCDSYELPPARRRLTAVTTEYPVSSGGGSVANWVKCTRKTDGTPIYINLDTVTWLRRNEAEDFTAIAWATGEQGLVRVWEYPEKILKACDVFTEAHEEIVKLIALEETNE